jgi:hypothetical protein
MCSGDAKFGENDQLIQGKQCKGCTSPQNFNKKAESFQPFKGW